MTSAAESGVSRDVALRALRAAGPPHTPYRLVVSDHPTNSNLTIIANADGKHLACEYLPNVISRRTINRLCLRCGIPKVWFYESLSIPGDEEKRKPC